MRFSVALICVMVIASGCGPSERERFEATEKLLSAWDMETNQSRADYIRVLISEGANVNAKDKNGRTPLMLASDPEVIKVLRDAGANGYTTEEVAEATAKLHRSFKQLQNPWVDQVRDLISKGADVNGKDLNGWTPLMLAVYKFPSPKIIELLLEKGADVNARHDATGFTPLALAARNNPTTAFAELLIDQGADVNARTSSGWTTLMVCLRFNDFPEMVTLLIQSGADVNAKDKTGRTTLSFASTAETKKLLIDAGAKE